MTTERTIPVELRNKIKILVAEDNLLNQKLVAFMLGNWGFNCDVCETGREAVERVKNDHYDLVLMDCMMPLMDGYEATRLLREREAAAGLPRLPVIALTASVIEGDRERCLAAGMDDYLPKPFTAAAFLAMIARWLPATPPDSSAPTDGGTSLHDSDQPIATDPAPSAENDPQKQIK